MANQIDVTDFLETKEIPCTRVTENSNQITSLQAQNLHYSKELDGIKGEINKVSNKIDDNKKDSREAMEKLSDKMGEISKKTNFNKVVISIIIFVSILATNILSGYVTSLF